MSRILLLILTLILLGRPAAAQEPLRLALVIGNQSYGADVGPLKNPHSDIQLVATALKSIGFEVMPPVKDARRSQILLAVRNFVTRLKLAGPNSVGFLYYSGHGAAESDTGTNYLIPVDAREPGSVTFWDESLKLDDVLKLLDAAPAAAKFVVFDACRNELRGAEKATTKGFVPVAEQSGMFISYATAQGRTATDQGLQGGPYATALAAEVVKPGVHHLDLFQNIKEAVTAKTGGAQVPWERNGLPRREYLAGLKMPSVMAAPAAVPVAGPPIPPVPPAVAAPVPGVPQRGPETELALWNAVKDSKSVASLQSYLDQYPDGVFRVAAMERIRALGATSAAKADPSPPNDDVSALARHMQGDLKRLGCLDGNVDGKWGPSSRGALEKFAARTKLSLPDFEPSAETQKRLAEHKGRGCPLTCDPDETEVNGRCVTKTPAWKEPAAKAPVVTAPVSKAPVAKPQASSPAAASVPKAATGDSCRTYNRCAASHYHFNPYQLSGILLRECGARPAGC